jgi:hypothetical protein
MGLPSIKVKTNLRLPQTKRTYCKLDIANATSLPISLPRLLRQQKTLFPSRVIIINLNELNSISYKCILPYNLICELILEDPVTSGNSNTLISHISEKILCHQLRAWNGRAAYME